MFFPHAVFASCDVSAEGYIPRATYSPCRDGCAGCGKPLPEKTYSIGAGVYHYKCYRQEKRAIRETERFLNERVGLGVRWPKVS